jgi:tetratricopeptide (TPR) repeat protein
VRASNSVGGVHLDLFDCDEAVRIGLEGDELAQKMWPWPEPRAHALLKVARAHLLRGELALTAEFLGRARGLLDADVWGRWRWHIVLERVEGELALVLGRRDDAWRHAGLSAEMAVRSASLKHVASARRLQGEILAAHDRLDEAAAALEEAGALAERLGTPVEAWRAGAELGTLLARMGRDAEAERHYGRAADTLDAVARGLRTSGLRRSFLAAGRVQAVYREAGRRPPGSGV